MADTDRIYLVFRKENAGIKNIFGAYASREVASDVVEEIVEDEVDRFTDEDKRAKAAERIEDRLQIQPLTVRSDPVF